MCATLYIIRYTFRPTLCSHNLLLNSPKKLTGFYYESSVLHLPSLWIFKRMCLPQRQMCALRYLGHTHTAHLSLQCLRFYASPRIVFVLEKLLYNTLEIALCIHLVTDILFTMALIQFKMMSLQNIYKTVALELISGRSYIIHEDTNTKTL